MIRYKNCLARDIKLVYHIPNYGYVVFNLTNKKIVKINSMEQLKVYYGNNAVLVDAIYGCVMRENSRYNLNRGDSVVFENRCSSIGYTGHAYTFTLRDVTNSPNDITYFALTTNRLLSIHLCYMIFLSRFILNDFSIPRSSILGMGRFIPSSFVDFLLSVALKPTAR